MMVSSIGKPNETTGIATATTVEAFDVPASASALSIKPIKRLPESPRKIVAGLKLNLKNPNMAPASASDSNETNTLPEASDTTKTVSVEKSAEPAASPSMPSIKLKAFVIHNTHNTVSGSDSH